MGTAVQRKAEPMVQRFSDWFEMPELFRFFDRERFGDMIKVEQTVNKDKVVIRAEMPGVDPDKDVDIELADGLLTIAAERRAEEKKEEDGRTVSEFRYGSFRRTLRVPKETKPTDVKAAYKDGILTITVPVPKAAKAEITKVPVSYN